MIPQIALSTNTLLYHLSFEMFYLAKHHIQCNIENTIFNVKYSNQPAEY